MTPLLKRGISGEPAGRAPDKLRRMAIRGATAISAAAAAFALSFCEGSASPAQHHTPRAAPVQADSGAGRRFESMAKCFDRISDDGLPDLFAQEMPPPARRRGEMEEQAETLERRLRRGRRSDALAVYMDFFEDSRFSTGKSMYPNVAKALAVSHVFQSDEEKLLAARRVVNVLKSVRVNNTHELLLFMPHTALSLIDTTDIGEMEDMSSFLLLLIGHARRLHNAEGVIYDGGFPMETLCRRIERGELTRITKEQLDGLDRLYSGLAKGFVEYESECRLVNEGEWITCDTKSDSAKNICEDVMRRIKAGELERYGVIGFDAPCSRVKREDRCGSPFVMFSRDNRYCGAVQKRRQERRAEENHE